MPLLPSTPSSRTVAKSTYTQSVSFSMAQAAQRGISAVNGTSSSSNANAGASGGGATASTSSNKDIPRDARIIGLILASLGVTDAEPGVVAMLLEFAHRK